MKGQLKFTGELLAKKRRHRLFNMRLPFGRLWFTRDRGEAILGSQWFNSHLTAEVTRADGSKQVFDLGSGLVTNAGVNLMGADWTNATATLKAMNWHDSGTGTTAAAVTDTALQTPSGIARVSGTQSNTNNVYTTQATITYNGTYAITEWGLFNANSVGTMWDHRVFAVINVSNTDTVTYRYNLTIASGG